MPDPTGAFDLEQFAATTSNASPAHVCVLLRRLLEQRCLLSVQIGNSSDCYTSAVLEVVHEHEYVVLDELTPREGHVRLSTEPRIQVKARLEGIEVRFASRVSRINSQNGLPYYKVPFPKLIEYPQRRQSYRVPIPLQLGLPTNILLADERVLNGELRDLSPEGLGMRVRLGVPDPADHGQLAICQIVVDKTLELVTDIEVCHVDPPMRGRVSRLGARFLRLRADQERRIEQFCAELAREQRRLR